VRDFKQCVEAEIDYYNIGYNAVVTLPVAVRIAVFVMGDGISTAYGNRILSAAFALITTAALRLIMDPGHRGQRFINLKNTEQSIVDPGKIFRRVSLIYMK
jgi:hypothetical protein